MFLLFLGQLLEHRGGRRASLVRPRARAAVVELEPVRSVGNRHPQRVARDTSSVVAPSIGAAVTPVRHASHVP